MIESFRDVHLNFLLNKKKGPISLKNRYGLLYVEYHMSSVMLIFWPHTHIIIWCR